MPARGFGGAAAGALPPVLAVCGAGDGPPPACAFDICCIIGPSIAIMPARGFGGAAAGALPPIWPPAPEADAGAPTKLLPAAADGGLDVAPGAARPEEDAVAPAVAPKAANGAEVGIEPEPNIVGADALAGNNKPPKA